MIHTNILIIGQGIAGSLLAWELWKRGADFLVMDDPHPATSSRVAAGLFVPLVFRTLKPVENIDNYFGSMEATYKEIEMALGEKIFHTLGSVRLIPQNEFHLWEKALNTEAGAFIKSINNPIHIKGIKREYAIAVIEPSGYLDVSEFINAITDWLKVNNRYLTGRVDYQSIKLKNGTVVINDLVQAEKVVFCEGAAGFQNPFFKHAGFSPNKGEIIEITAPRLSIDTIIRGEVFILPMGNDKFKVGATYSHDLSTDQPTQAGLRELTSKLEKMIDVPYQVLSHTAGIRPGIKDRKPLLGSHPEYPELCIFNGLGSRGVLYGPYYARLMAGYLTRETDLLPGEVGVGRYLGE
jgi:glycine oxidase